MSRRPSERWVPLGAIAMVVAGCAPANDDDTTPPSPRHCNGAEVLCDRPFDQVTLPTTHNAMSNADEGWLVPNQQHGMARQLDDGVRGFLLDTHYDQGGLALCHSFCGAGRLELVQGLSVFTDFLTARPNEVIALLFQDGISAEDTASAFAEAGLDGLVYTHGGGEWPTLGAMIDAGTRIVVGAEFSGPPPAWYHHAWDLWFDTPYSFDSVDAFSCALNRGSADNPLLLVNHWISDPFSLPSYGTIANAEAVLGARARQCEDELGQRINLLAVDHYAVGDLFEVTRALNGIQ